MKKEIVERGERSSPALSMPPEVAGVSAFRGEDNDFGILMGLSLVMQALYVQIEQAAPHTAPVLITGEAGTGKKRCAQALHRRGPRARGSFITIHATTLVALPMLEEIWMQAAGGTLFIADIPALSTPLQDYLLTLLGNISPDVRLIGSAPYDAASRSNGFFRGALHKRLQGLSLTMPPLRVRGDDIIDLASLFLRHRSFSGFTAEAESLLKSHAWPGNVSQLRHVMECLSVQPAETINDNDPPPITASLLAPFLSSQNNNPLPPAARTPTLDLYGEPDEIRTLAEVERKAIERALHLCGGNIPRAAARLGLSPSTLYRKKAAWEPSGGNP